MLYVLCGAKGRVRQILLGFYLCSGGWSGVFGLLVCYGKLVLILMGCERPCKTLNKLT